MKSLLFAPAVLSLIHATYSAEAVSVSQSLPELAAITQVVAERPLVELPAPPPFVPVVIQEDNRLDALKGELEQLGASLKATQQAVDNVARQRDEAREEVRALAKANHDLLQEMKDSRTELETAKAEVAKWKEHAAMMERKANDQALANAALERFRNELQGAMQDFQAMKGDIAKAREAFVDPIERANLKQELAQSEAKRERLGAEIEMALIAREKTIQESAQTRKELEEKMATLAKEAQSAKELRDELRSANAVKMKALADVEVLRKDFATSEAAGKETLAQLETAQNGLTALQAEKAAAMEARAVAVQERDTARTESAELRKQMEAAVAQMETSKQEIADVSGKLQAAEEAMAVTVRERDAAQSERAELQERVEGAVAQLNGSAMVIVRLAAKIQATDEALAVATRERDAARSEMASVQEQMTATQQELATAKKEAAEAAELAKTAEASQQESAQKLADTSGTLEKTKEELQFLNDAKGGLEALLFKKTAEIRTLRGELRKMQASNDESPKSPDPAPGQETDEKRPSDLSRAQALAD